MAKLPRCVAIVVCIFLLGTAVAQPRMTLSTEGRGQVLHYPYYTVLGQFDTYFSILNTTRETKAARVRLLDSKNGRVALEFNVFLSPFDVWAGALTLDTASGGARLGSTDTSCTVPSFPASGVLLQNTRFDERDNAGKIINDSFSRTSQGFIEVIEMGVVVDPRVLSEAVHVSGVPRSCTNAQTVLYSTNPLGLQPAAASAFGPPKGGLSGTATLINVGQGVDFSYDAVAIENVFTSAQHDVPGQTKPSVADAQREVLFVDNGRAYSATFATGFDAISALFTSVQWPPMSG
jgi:hypothetical protein